MNQLYALTNCIAWANKRLMIWVFVTVTMMSMFQIINEVILSLLWRHNKPKIVENRRFRTKLPDTIPGVDKHPLVTFFYDGKHRARLYQGHAYLAFYSVMINRKLSKMHEFFSIYLNYRTPDHFSWLPRSEPKVI